ncbi:MAG: hypothetical protein IJ410_08280 [Oscillospiraceae bacterium]|nr:hypothetical protein [Oscillospiraceae bacterium]
MKSNRIITVFIFTAILIIVFNGYTVFSLRNTDKTILHTGVYTERRVNSAMNTVSRYFTVFYPDCKLTRLYTNESGVSETDRLVILADYDVGSIVRLHPSMNTNSTYTRWQFELINICGVWFITNQGYC